MSWDLDTPQMPFKKPSQIEILEQMGRDQREAMDFQEIGEHIDAAADSMASAYERSSHDTDFDTCVTLVGSALVNMGGALGGKVGAIMVGTSDRVSRRACREVFPEDL